MRVLCIFLSTVSLIWLVSCASVPTGDQSYVLHENLIYSEGDGWELGLDLAVPSLGKGPYPVVVYFYGGDFDRLGLRVGRRLIPDTVAAGYAMVSVDHRGVENFAWPAQVYDAKNAVRWVRAHAADYNLDPDRIAARGFSSGGYLALMLGLTGPDDGFEQETAMPEISSEVQAVVCHAGITDFRLKPIPRFELLLRGSVDEVPDLWAKASAVTYVDGANDAPVLTIVGPNNPYIHLDHALAFDAQMNAAGNVHVLVVDSSIRNAITTPGVVWWFLDGVLAKRSP